MLPPLAGVYCLTIEGGSPHLAWSSSLLRRLKRMLIEKPGRAGGPAADLRLRLERIECWPTTSKLESSLLMYSLARKLFPEDYAKRLRMRLPWFVGVNESDGLARLTVSNRRGRDHQSIWGPFPSRDAAEYYQEEVLRLYQIRRCSEPLVPSPDHPGCIYGEMNQCIRPCQCAVSREEYATEVARVREFLTSNGKTVLSNLSMARASASENMEFEQAAYIHKRIEQVKTAIGARDEFVAALANFHGVAVTKGLSADEVRLWPMLEGCWQEPIALDVSVEQARPKSMDADLRERLMATAAANRGDDDPFEHLSLFLRWHRSSWREGRWVGSTSLASLNYRKLVREISKLAKES